MSAKGIRILVALRGHVGTADIEQMVLGEPGLELAGMIDNDADWAAREGFQADALVIACDGPQPAVLQLVDEEIRIRPAMPVVVLCGGSPGGFVRQVLEAGADDIVAADRFELAGAELYFAIQKAMSRKVVPRLVAGDGRQGKVICVLGPKGGTGKTLTASNLAVALAAEGKKVAVVDLDLQFGDLGLVMGIPPERTIFDLATAGGSLDASKVDAFLSSHASGVRVLLAPKRPDQAAAVTPELLRELYAVLRGEFEYIVVDTPPGFTPEVIATIDESANVCLIGMLDAPSLKNAKLGIETLEMMGYPAGDVRLVLNRADTSVGISHADVVSILGRAPDVLVPSAREIVRSVNAGEPIVSSSARSEPAKAFRALAVLLVKLHQPPALVALPERRRGLRAMARS